jgi:hypothetical protein
MRDHYARFMSSSRLARGGGCRWPERVKEGIGAEEPSGDHERRSRIGSPPPEKRPWLRKASYAEMLDETLRREVPRSSGVASLFRQNATATHFERELTGARPTKRAPVAQVSPGRGSLPPDISLQCRRPQAWLRTCRRGLRFGTSLLRRRA